MDFTILEPKGIGVRKDVFSSKVVDSKASRPKCWAKKMLR